MKTFQEFEAHLAQSLPSYESRPPQQRFAAVVEQGLDSGRHVIAEAGCGTGKSFGYSIPAVLAAVNAGKRVVISTATKALQDQLCNEDLPFLAAKFAEAGKPFRWSILKGRANYVCPEKAADADAPVAKAILEFLKTAPADFTGEQHEFPFAITPGEWFGVAAETEDCGDLGCSRKGICYAAKARALALTAQVVVVNHALLFTDLMVRVQTDGDASMLGDYQSVIFDEAHEAEDWATKTLGAKFTTGSIRGLVGEARTLAQRAGVDTSFLERPMVAANNLFTALVPGRLTERTILNQESLFDGLAEALFNFAREVGSISLEGVDQNSLQATVKKKNRVLRRATGLAARYADFLTASDDDLVRWVERDQKGNASIQTAPINVGPFLKANLFDKTQATLCSATMAINGSFEYIAGRLGVQDYLPLDVGSPFDFKTQSVLYVPADLPAPAGVSKGRWEDEAPERMLELVTASRGRALLLFTSLSAMRNAHAKIASRIPYTVFMQGERPNKQLAAEFKSDTHSVLFATRSFFTGTDVQGESLSLVVIDKLPFSSPTDAVLAARSEAIEKRGGNSFNQLTVPIMSLVLKQAHGRLIRHRNDRGVVAILDSRLLTKGYGKRIINSLPDSPLVKTIGDVEDFFAKEVVSA